MAQSVLHSIALSRSNCGVEQGKIDFGSPSVFAQHERGACNLPGKVAFLKMSTARCCAQIPPGQP